MFLKFRVVGLDVPFLFDFSIPTRLSFGEPLNLVDFGLHKIRKVLSSSSEGISEEMKRKINKEVEEIYEKISEHGRDSVDVEKLVSHLEAMKGIEGKVRFLLQVSKPSVDTESLMADFQAAKTSEEKEKILSEVFEPKEKYFLLLEARMIDVNIPDLINLINEKIE